MITQQKIKKNMVLYVDEKQMKKPIKRNKKMKDRPTMIITSIENFFIKTL